MLASLYCHYDLVKYLIENKAKITKKDKYKRTALLHAVRGGQLKIVSYLLTKGAEFEQGIVLIIRLYITLVLQDLKILLKF